MKTQIRIDGAYNKICTSIDSSTNKLHLDTCCVMIGRFNMMFLKEEEEAQFKKVITDKEHDLKIKLDEKAQRLGLLVI